MMEEQKPKGEFFVEPIGGYTNNAIYYELIRWLGLQPELEQEEYKDRKNVPVFKVNYPFCKVLYENKEEKKYEFVIYIKVKGSLRHWELFRPDVKKRARAGREAWKKGRKGIKYNKPDH